MPERKSCRPFAAFIGLLLLFLLGPQGAGPSAAFAQTPATYPAPTYLYLTKSLIRLGAVDVNKDQVLDEYAMVSECDLYKQYYGNDFTWQKIRDKLREKIRMELPTIPTAYTLESPVRLGRYDFAQQKFELDAQTPIRSVNAFTLSVKNARKCGDRDRTIFPEAYRAQLDFPFTISGIPMATEDAQQLLARMQGRKNEDRTIYVRFNVRLVFADPLRLEERNYRKKDRYSFDARLESVEFYEDPKFMSQIYAYAP